MGAMEPTDESLVAGFQESGRIENLDLLVARHVPEVRRMIRAMVMNNSDADDVTQEVFLNVVRSVSNFRAEAKFKTWLYRIAMNTAITFLNKKKISPVLYREVLSEPASETLDPREGEAQRDELNAEISRGMESLTPPERSAIVLTYVQGLSGRDAAKIAGCPLPTFHWRLYKARKSLRNHLKDHVQR